MRSKYHYTVEVIDKRNPLKIGSVVHTKKERNERIKELQESGWKRNEIKITTYITD